jgi:peptidoglycan hydrolase-like protein with peptidoglycan-binding domain
MIRDWYKRRIFVATTPEEHDAVIHVQRVFSIEPTGNLDYETKSRIRGLQKLFNLPVTGIIDDATAEQIERIFPFGA